MAKSLEEKRREREAAKKAAESVRPPAPKAAPLAEPPAGKEETPRTQRTADSSAVAAALAGPAAVQAAESSAPPAAPEPTPAPSPKVMVPKALRAAPAPAKKAPPPLPEEVPPSLAGLPPLDAPDASALAEPPKEAPAPETVSERPKSDPPAKPTTRKIAFKAEGDGRRIGDVRVEYEGPAGPGAMKAKVTAFGKEREVVLSQRDEQSVKFPSPAGPEVSVTLMFTGANKEGDKEVLVDITGMESGSDKAKQAATAAVSKAGSLAAKLKYNLPEVILGAFGVALSTTVLAVSELRLWMEQHMHAWRWPAVIGVPLVMVGLAVWSSIENGKKPEGKKPEEKKSDDKKEA